MIATYNRNDFVLSSMKTGTKVTYKKKYSLIIFPIIKNEEYDLGYYECLIDLIASGKITNEEVFEKIMEIESKHPELSADMDEIVRKNKQSKKKV